MSRISHIEESKLLSEIQNGSQDAFSTLFTSYYCDLVLFAGRYISTKEQCEDIVQSVFLKIWDERAGLVIRSSVKLLLLQAVKYKCFDEIRHNNVVFRHESYTKSRGEIDDMNTYDYVLYSDLNKHLDSALASLPEDCRDAFVMSRFKGIQYRDIAAKFGVSERTIEVRVGKALKMLKVYLKEYFLLILLCI